jgi:hypothetical protein
MMPCASWGRRKSIFIVLNFKLDKEVPGRLGH